VLVLILLISFSIFLIIGVPIAFVLGLTPLVAFLYQGETPLMLAAQRIFTGMDNPILMAIPFCKVLVGPVRGGLAHINVFISMIFAGITGAAVADTSAIGLIPAMEREGYDVDFSSAVTATSSTIGPVIPPSIPFIIYGVLGEVSIAYLFLAGVIPGLLLGLFQMGVVAYYARKRNYPKGSLPSAREALRAIFDAGLVLMMPIIILGGILSGVFTPTESACIAVFYALAMSFFVYRNISLRDLPRIVINTGATSAIVMLVIGTASIFSWLLASEEVPQSVTALILKVTHNRILILLLVNIFLLIVGTFMETTASLIILTPVLLPLMIQIGVDPLHFGVILVLNLVIGLTTPPVGVCLFIACAIGKIRLERISRAILPFILASIAVLVIATYWESLIMFIPRYFGYVPLIH
jgi:C4-dicarboxylate transporter DctM subunit